MPDRPFATKGSNEFISECKAGNEKVVAAMLEDRPHLVYQYDNIGMTGIHWACKRNHEKCVEVMMKYKPYLEGADMLGRKPIYLALSNQNAKVLRLLLSKMCSPWTYDRTPAYKRVCKNNINCMIELEKYRKVAIY